MSNKKRRLQLLIIILSITVWLFACYPKPWVIGGLVGGPLGLGQTAFREEFACMGAKFMVPQVNCADCGPSYPCFGIRVFRTCTLERYDLDLGIVRTPVACNDASMREGIDQLAVMPTSPATATRLRTIPFPTASFETGAEGWEFSGEQTQAGTVEQSAEFASRGRYSLKITTAQGGWLGVRYDTPVNLTGLTQIKFEIRLLTGGATQNAAIQISGQWGKCQGTGGWIDPDITSTVKINLLTLGCDTSPDLAQVYSFQIWLSGGGTFYLDNVRAE